MPQLAYVPLGFAPGEAYQFDWSHETITLNGLPLLIKAAHMKLSHSRMPFVRAYFRETQELVFRRARQGVPLLRRRVPSRHLRQYENGGGGDLCWQGGASITAAFCRCARIIWSSRWPARRLRVGKKAKSRIRSVTCDQLFRPKPRVSSLAELNAWLEDQCIAYARRHQHPEFKDRTIWDVFQTSARA